MWFVLYQSTSGNFSYNALQHINKKGIVDISIKYHSTQQQLVQKSMPV